MPARRSERGKSWSLEVAPGRRSPGRDVTHHTPGSRRALNPAAMSGRLLKPIGILFRPYPTDFLLLHNLNLLEFSLQARLPTIGLEYSTPHHLRLTYSVSRNSNRPAPGGPIPGEDLRGVADPSDLRHHCQLVYIPSHTLIVRVIKELVDQGWRQVDSGIDTGDLLDTPANSKLALSNRRSRLYANIG